MSRRKKPAECACDVLKDSIGCKDAYRTSANFIAFVALEYAWKGRRAAAQAPALRVMDWNVRYSGAAVRAPSVSFW